MDWRKTAIAASLKDEEARNLQLEESQRHQFNELAKHLQKMGLDVDAENVTYDSANHIRYGLGEFTLGTRWQSGGYGYDLVLIEKCKCGGDLTRRATLAVIGDALRGLPANKYHVCHAEPPETSESRLLNALREIIMENSYRQD